MRLGIIGIGHLGAALVQGWCDGNATPPALTISPRGAARAADLAARFPSVTVATDNQAVLDASDTVLLAVRPDQAEAVLAPLHFRADHLVVSVMATLPLARVAGWVKPATRLQRAVPLVSAARRYGPCAVWPALDETRALWDAISVRVDCRDEHEFETLWAITALISPFYSLLDAMHHWCIDNGADADAAAHYLPAFFETLAREATGRSGAEGFRALSEAAQTRGGLNEQALGIVVERGADAAFVAALDAIRQRMAAAANG